MKREPLITVTDAPDPRVEQLIGDSLRRYNAEKSGIDDSRPLAVVVSDPDTREILGGISGRTSRGLLFVDLVYLPDNLRGDGLGSHVLTLAEDEGRRRGCRAAVLYTNGWRVFGEIPCEPPGTSRIFMTKTL